jgi:hypothetical protein
MLKAFFLFSPSSSAGGGASPSYPSAAFGFTGYAGRSKVKGSSLDSIGSGDQMHRYLIGPIFFSMAKKSLLIKSNPLER